MVVCSDASVIGREIEILQLVIGLGCYETHRTTITKQSVNQLSYRLD